MGEKPRIIALGLKILYYRHVHKDMVQEAIDELWNEGKIVLSMEKDKGLIKIKFYQYDFFTKSIIKELQL